HDIEPMNLFVDEELHAIETISSRTQFLINLQKDMLYFRLRMKETIIAGKFN
ncbi:hypothetical protein EDC96DRAFT_440997, partial [Choanephora cucurbitarum]